MRDAAFSAVVPPPAVRRAACLLCVPQAVELVHRMIYTIVGILAIIILVLILLRLV